MTITQRITREPALITSALRAILYCAILFGVPLTVEQSAGLLLAVEAVLAVITRQVVVPAAEVVASRKPGDATALAGPATGVAENGEPVVVRALI